MNTSKRYQVDRCVCFYQDMLRLLTLGYQSWCQETKKQIQFVVPCSLWVSVFYSFIYPLCIVLVWTVKCLIVCVLKWKWWWKYPRRVRLLWACAYYQNDTTPRQRFSVNIVSLYNQMYILYYHFISSRSFTRWKVWLFCGLVGVGNCHVRFTCWKGKKNHSY